jgi:uncharacterized protein (DUF433 family)
LLSDVVERDPDKLGGVPLFRDTRVPVQALFDYLRGGKSISNFLDDFEGVSPRQVAVVLEAAAADVLKRVQAA